VKRLALVLTTLVLAACAPMLGACGEETPQGTGASPSAGAEEGEREYDLDETAQTAAGHLGGEGAAAYAVMKAFDSGYSPYQIAHAIDAGLIDESGGIEGLTPAWPAGDTISRNEAAPVEVAAVDASRFLPTLLADTGSGLPTRAGFEELFAKLSEAGESGRWLAWLLGVTGMGYSAGQIIQYLEVNMPYRNAVPPNSFGVPVLVDAEGDLVDAELPADWPYWGRGILIDLHEDEDLDWEDDWTVLVIGMVNAGYSKEEIDEAFSTRSVGLCSTQSGSSDGEVTFAPCWVKDGELVKPADDTGPYSPAEILIGDVLPEWPTNLADIGNGEAVSRARVSLELTPYLPSPDSHKQITSYEIVMEIEPAANGTWYEVEGSWRIELLETETDESINRSYVKGERHVLEGQFYTTEPRPLDDLRLDTVGYWTFYEANGEHGWEQTDDTDGGFTGSLDQDLKGWGSLGAYGPCLVNWKHPSDYEPHPAP